MAREGERRSGWAFYGLGFAFLVTMLGTTLPTPLYPLYQQSIGLSSLMVTVVFAVYAAAVVVTLAAVGTASDHVGRRTLLLPGLAFSAASAVCFVAANDVGLILLGRVLSGVSAGVFVGTATAAMVDLAPAGDLALAALIAVGVNIGGLGLGPLLSGAIAEAGWGDPLRVPYVVDLVLVVPALAFVWAAPETVRGAGGARVLTYRRLRLPPEARAAFLPAATAGFTAFAVSGLFGSVGPGMLGEVLHDTSPLLAGGVVALLFAASAVAQVMLRVTPGIATLPIGCGTLIVGVVVLAAAVLVPSLALLIASALITGLGQGLVVGAGLPAVTSRTSPERRGEVASLYFVVCYVGLCLPVIGVGLLTQSVTLTAAAVTFSCAVVVVTTAALMRIRAVTAA